MGALTVRPWAGRAVWMRPVRGQCRASVTSPIQFWSALPPAVIGAPMRTVLVVPTRG